MSEVSIQDQVRIPARGQGQIDAMKARRWRTDLVGIAFVLPFLVVYAVFLIWPVIQGLRMSLFNWSIGGNGSSQFLGLSNYQELLGDPAFWSSVGTTVLFTIISTPILVVLALILALLVNRAIPVQGLFRTIFFAPFILPVSVVTLIWGWLYQPDFGLIDGMLAGFGLKGVGWLTDPNIALMSVVILTVWWTVGYNFVLYLSGMQQIPQEINEAASLDGAGTWTRIRYITIPLLNRFTSLIIILQVIASLQLFTQTYLLTAGGPNFVTRSIIQYIYEQGFTSFRVGFAAAMTYVFFILVLVVTITQFSLLMRQRRDY